MDVAGSTAARNDVVRLRPVPEQPMVAATVVCHWPGRRLNSISRFATESYRSADDLLATATAARIWGNDIFRHLLLPWQRRCVPEPGVAIERRSGYPGIYEPISAGHVRAM